MPSNPDPALELAEKLSDCARDFDYAFDTTRAAEMIREFLEDRDCPGCKNWEANAEAWRDKYTALQEKARALVEEWNQLCTPKLKEARHAK